MLSLRALWRDETGAQLAEYVLLVTLIAIVCIVGVTAFGQAVAALYANAESSI
ncbi:MAG: Flp family type IVb pilin [Candidatus Cybelea sp.]|jgi:Flp pilus assembly pilin Flp